LKLICLNALIDLDIQRLMLMFLLLPYETSQFYHAMLC